MVNFAGVSPSAEYIAHHFEQCNFRVVQTDSCWWYNEYHQERVYFAFPPHRRITPSVQEIAHIFHDAPRALALRFLADGNISKNPSFIWVRRKPYNIQVVSSSSRSKIRRGLERCDIRKLSFAELVSLGWIAHRDTLRRHGQAADTFGIDESLSECPAYEAWGAFVNDDLAAFLVTLWVEDWVHLLINRSMDVHLKMYPNNALVFTVVQELLARSGVSTISYGLEPLSAKQTLDQFKESMGFFKEPVRQRIVLRPWLRPLLNPLARKLIELGAQILSANVHLQQWAGICRLISN